MKDVNKMTPEELGEEISQRSTEMIKELGNGEILSKEQLKKKRVIVKRGQKGMKGLTRKLSKKMRATKSGKR